MEESQSALPTSIIFWKGEFKEPQELTSQSKYEASLVKGDPGPGMDLGGVGGEMTSALPHNGPGTWVYSPQIEDVRA